MSGLRVFPDTGTFLAMALFPLNREGKPTLAGEVLQLYDAGAFDFVISRAVVDELEGVIERDFPHARFQANQLLARLAASFARWPTPDEIATALPFAADPEDAPIFAAAVVAQPDTVLSNDFRAFHTPQAKVFWQEHNITVESLYGLLCVFGRRERKDTS